MAENFNPDEILNLFTADDLEFIDDLLDDDIIDDKEFVYLKKMTEEKNITIEQLYEVLLKRAEMLNKKDIVKFNVFWKSVIYKAENNISPTDNSNMSDLEKIIDAVVTDGKVDDDEIVLLMQTIQREGVSVAELERMLLDKAKEKGIDAFLFEKSWTRKKKAFLESHPDYEAEEAPAEEEQTGTDIVVASTKDVASVDNDESDNAADSANDDDIKKEKKEKKEKYPKSDKGKMTWKSIVYYVIVGLLGLFILLAALNCIKYAIEKSKFRSFDLANLKKQEFIIQKIEFKKFLAHGTAQSNNEYADELQIYHISGYANVSFTDIDHLEIDEENSDYDKKILRLNYKPSDNREIPFNIDVIIEEKDINQVANLKSKEFEIKLLGIKHDFAKPGLTPSEQVAQAKEELKKEFEKQIIGNGSAKDLSKMDIYQTFLRRLTDLVSKASDWENVEVKFVKE